MCMYIYIYIYMYVYTYIYMYMYIHIPYISRTVSSDPSSEIAFSALKNSIVINTARARSYIYI